MARSDDEETLILKLICEKQYSDCIVAMNNSFGAAAKSTVRKVYPSIASLADDVVQGALMEASKKLPKFEVDGPASVKTWFLGIVKNVALREREKQSQASASLENLAGSHTEASRNEPSWRDDEQLQQFIAALDAIDKDILEAHYAKERGEETLNYEELAKKHGKKGGTLRQRGKRLLEKLAAIKLELGIENDRVSFDAVVAMVKNILSAIRDNSGSSRRSSQDATSNEMAKTIARWIIGNAPKQLKELPPSKIATPQYVSTGISALDTLLGGKGFVQGSFVLIQGEPGDGKTTLALQIAKAAIERGHDFGFASVEDEPEILINQITQSFWEQNHVAFLGDPMRWRMCDVAKYFDVDVRSDAVKSTFSQWLSPLQLELLAKHPDVGEKLLNEPSLRVEASSAIRSTLREMEIESVLTAMWKDLVVDMERPVLLVIDSLNALINGADTRFRAESQRQVILAVLNSFRKWRRGRRGQVTVIFLVEANARITAAAASYLADVVIDLQSQDVEQTIYLTPGQPAKWSQNLRFCRVRKGRGLPTQRRSCAYEFAKGPRKDRTDSGVVFLPTYAATGVVSLFCENAPMQDVIHTLRTHDVPALFPQVFVQEFTRNALQRVFSVNRRRGRIAIRHPMTLSNVDEYWLKQLKDNGLLEPIPSSKLTAFSSTSSEPATASNEAGFIHELDAKEEMFAGQTGAGKVYYGVPQIANVGMLVYRKDVLETLGRGAPETWEEVENICMLLREKNERAKSVATRPKAQDLPTKLFLELTSHDTFLATALELGWGHGAFWKTEPKDGALRIKFDKGSGVQFLIAALARIKYWIWSLEILPKGCSVDPDANPSDDWVFARHWYSTWINVCTHERTRDLLKKGAYGVCPIPVAENHNQSNGGNAPHHSAWGEWYLALLRGSENIELGIELINNLMTARKITERARSGAALPTVEKFYSITDEDCPETDLTFKEMRERFFANAKSRSEFSDYPRVARFFSAVLRTVATNRNANVIDAVKKGFLNIDPAFQWPNDIDQRLQEIVPEPIFKLLRAK